MHVFVLERVPELNFVGRRAALTPHIGDVGLVVGREPERSLLADDGERLACGRFEPVGHARIVGAEDDIVTFEFEGQLVVFVFDRLFAVDRRGDHFVCAAPRRARKAVVGAQHAAVAERQRQRGIAEHQVVPVVEAVSYAVRRRHFDAKRPRRRLKGEFPGCGRCAQGRQKAQGQGK